jgi:hypothetical protein
VRDQHPFDADPDLDRHLHGNSDPDRHRLQHCFSGQRIITTTRSHGTGLIQDTLNLLEPTEETLHREKTPF